MFAVVVVDDFPMYDNIPEDSATGLRTSFGWSLAAGVINTKDDDGGDDDGGDAGNGNEGFDA